MKKLVDSERWNDRWWVKDFDKDMILLACWLWDHADVAGFVEFDVNEAAEETCMSHSEALSGYQRLLESPSGTGRLSVRVGGSPKGDWIWIKNYVKCQIKGMRFTPPAKDKNPSGMQWAIAKVLAEREKEWPEVKCYKGFKSLLVRGGATKSHSVEVGGTQCHNKENKDNSIKREREYERDHLQPAEAIGEYEMTHEDSLYTSLLEVGIAIKWDQWLELRKKHPDNDIDWPEMVEYVVGCQKNSVNGVDTPWQFFSNLCRKPKFMKEGARAIAAAGGTTSAKKKEGMQKRSDLNEKYMSGDLDDDEVRRLHAENDAEYGL